MTRCTTSIYRFLTENGHMEYVAHRRDTPAHVTGAPGTAYSGIFPLGVRLGKCIRHIRDRGLASAGRSLKGRIGNAYLFSVIAFGMHILYPVHTRLSSPKLQKMRTIMRGMHNMFIWQKCV